jgi:hypothetical protein
MMHIRVRVLVSTTGDSAAADFFLAGHEDIVKWEQVPEELTSFL